MECISKLCADNLRTFANNNFSIKLKASHAHELVAAYFGYKSRAALIADTISPIYNLPKAEIIVMSSDKLIDQRRSELEELPLELPDSYTLGESVYAILFSDRWWKGLYPPFRSFEALARFIVENNDSVQHIFRFYKNLPMHHVVDVKAVENDIHLTVLHCYETSSEELVSAGSTHIKLPRVAGHIGYGRAQVSFERHIGQARQILKKNPEKQL